MSNFRTAYMHMRILGRMSGTRTKLKLQQLHSSLSSGPSRRGRPLGRAQRGPPAGSQTDEEGP